MIQKEKRTYEEIGKDLGSLVAKKQKAYGKSVNKTFEILKILMSEYSNDDGTYTIPEGLLRHIFLQARIIDKQNRIFTHPNGDLMGESPYRDMGGYSIIGLSEIELKRNIE